MDRVSELLTYFLPLLGVFIGWILTKKNENDKIRYSELRQVKRSLYVLLEIRNQLVVTQKFDGYLKVLAEKINERVQSHTGESVDTMQFKELMRQLLPSLIGNNFRKDLMEQFSKTIDGLSEVDPILAYRISGKQNIQDYLESWDGQAERLFEFEKIEDLQKAKEYFRPKIVDEIDDVLVSMILDVARLISFREVGKVKEIIDKQNDWEVGTEKDGIFDRIFDGIPS